MSICKFQGDWDYRSNAGFPKRWFMYWSQSSDEVVEVLLKQIKHTEDGELLLRRIWKDWGV